MIIINLHASLYRVSTHVFMEEYKSEYP